MPCVTVVIPTLYAGVNLQDCLTSLARQRFQDFETVVVDNGGAGAASSIQICGFRHRTLEMKSNVGFGAAINAAIRQTDSEFIATLNDDAVVDADWMPALLKEAERHPEAGMFAPSIRIFGTTQLDSAGMLLGADGSSKQRGRLERDGDYNDRRDTLFPSGCAALYRRAMLQKIGLFEEDFFLYCEDTDLGLRACRAGWSCRYVPEARVDHRYSKSVERSAGQKAWLVERNRLRVALHHFPWRMLLRAPFFSLARYYWHWRFPFETGLTKKQAAWIAVRAHVDLLQYLPKGLARRRLAEKTASLSSAQFCRLISQHSITAKSIAEQAARGGIVQEGGG